MLQEYTPAHIKFTSRFMNTVNIDIRLNDALGYIDNIKAKDMPDNIACGEDRYGRIFIAFLMKEINEEDDVAPRVHVIFQRYPKYNTWACAGEIRLHCEVDQSQLPDIKKLFDLLPVQSQSRKGGHYRVISPEEFRSFRDTL